jgi:hypothetical protein
LQITSGCHKIKEWIDQEYAKGRVTSISDDEMMEQARIHLSDLTTAYNGTYAKR